MSLFGDGSRRLVAQVHAALYKAAFGRSAGTSELRVAIQVAAIREGLPELRGSFNIAELIKKLPPKLRRILDECARSLLEAALHGKLSEVERARRIVERNVGPNHTCQEKVLFAYLRSIRGDGSPPTLAEVRAEFLRKHHESLLPKEFVMRNMVRKTFGLPLGKARRGRPIIRNGKR
jgi:hypothetical protein